MIPSHEGWPSSRVPNQFAADSALEEDGFELPAPSPKTGAFLNRLLPPLQLAKPVETEAFDPGGTGGSNPSSSTSESRANLIFGGESLILDDEGDAGQLAPLLAPPNATAEKKADTLFRMSRHSARKEVAALICVRRADTVQLRAQEIDEPTKIRIVVQRDPLRVYEVV